MASDSTDLYLPPSFPYPIKIISIDAKESSTIQRGTRLLSYSFAYLSRSAPPGSQIETRFGTWDAAIEGTVDRWNIKAGDVVDSEKARRKPVVLVTEPCKHGMQLGGLCVFCGKDMTNIDYTGFSDASRASIQMTHSAFGPTVSLEEAQRIERETAKDLLKSRKLSLIVDLDQTIVHATVDPTVGEWIAEGEAWEAQQKKKAQAGPKDRKPREDDDTDDDDSDSESDDECNPNWEALKDVKKFRLGPESFQAPPHGPNKSKVKKQTIENDGCMYYIKPRPGWKDFLRETATKYEMHVYTMGTRAYAEEVCAAIDPDGSIFGGRVLSRDESGSLTQKSLQRLFPCDTSMVVIIDDRADVWEWSPNLIKVIPYDFYVGIGDINSTFLPKVQPLVPPGSGGSGSSSDSKVKPDPSAPAETPNPISSEASTKSKLVPPEPSSTTDPDQAKLETDAMIRKNSAELEAQLEERPLAKKQEALSEGEPPLHHHHHHHHDHEHKQDKPSDAPADSGAESSASAPTLVEAEAPVQHAEKVTRKALLNNDDSELQRVKGLLDEVHQRFFDSYDASDKKSPSSKGKQPFDVTKIIPEIRTEVFSGVHILFSSVIPLDTPPESTEVWQLALRFGAKCSTELTSDITHVVALRRGTVKVDMARKRKGIKIVWYSWFQDCINQRRRLDETSYLLDPEHSHSTAAIGSTTPPTDPHQISSDPDPDEDDWDQDPVTVGEHADGQGLGLELTAINWDDINAEVDEFLNETDDEDDGASVKSDNESVLNTGSVTNTPSRKRNRSVTPSSANGSPNGSDDELRSPLAKRKKLAADRVGYSRLKDSISANEITKKSTNGSAPPSPSPLSRPDEPMDEDGDEEEEDEEEEEEEEEDFLAEAFEEEDWG